MLEWKLSVWDTFCMNNGLYRMYRSPLVVRNIILNGRFKNNFGYSLTVTSQYVQSVSEKKNGVANYQYYKDSAT